MSNSLDGGHYIIFIFSFSIVKERERGGCGESKGAVFFFKKKGEQFHLELTEISFIFFKKKKYDNHKIFLCAFHLKNRREMKREKSGGGKGRRKAFALQLIERHLNSICNINLVFGEGRGICDILISLSPYLSHPLS